MATYTCLQKPMRSMQSCLDIYCKKILYNVSSFALACFVIGTVGGCFIGCGQASSFRQLRHALVLAGENRQELESVLDHYRKEPMKRKAACYLITNMIYHTGQDDYLEAPDGTRHDFSLKPFSSQKMAAKKYCDSLQRCGYQLRHNGLPDIKTVSGDFLIKNIDLAFEAWEKPWAKDVSFDDFCRYILPYRSQSEKICPLRAQFMERYLAVVEAAQATTPLEACIAVNNQLRQEIRYFATGSPLYPTIEETLESGVSKCEGLANFCAFAMRSVGIPVMIDYTTWPKMGLGHVWCTVRNTDGRLYDFNPAHEYLPENRLAWYHANKLRVPAKVYRFEFALPSENEKMDPADSPTVHDVTSLYPFPVLQLDVELLPEYAGERGPVYLCVFNRNNWVPLARGKRIKNRAVIPDVVGDNVFIVADCPDGKTLRNVSTPFFVDSIGNMRYFKEDFTCRDSVVVRKSIVKDHRLSYWNNNRQCFEEYGDADAETDTTQTYRHLPHNALLLHAFPPHAWHDARIFFAEQGAPRIY